MCWWRSQPKSQIPIPRSQNSTKSRRNTRIVHFSSLIHPTDQRTFVGPHFRSAPPKSRQQKSPISAQGPSDTASTSNLRKSCLSTPKCCFPRASDLTRGSTCTCLTCRESQRCYYTCCAIATLPSATLGCYRGSQQMSAMHA